MNILNLLAKSSLHLIVVKPDNIEPVGFGSGCIVKYKSRYFLLSVAHVTDLEGLATCIETNLPTEGRGSQLYSVGAMSYYDEYKLLPSVDVSTIKTIEELLDVNGKTLDITFCEIKEQVELLQPEWDFGGFKIEKGEKVLLNLEEAGEPENGKLFGLCGRIRQDVTGAYIKSQPTLKLGLEYKGIRGREHVFLTPEIIKDADDYRGCSGAPILDEDGKLVALASRILKGSRLLYGFSIDECKRLLDWAMVTKLV